MFDEKIKELQAVNIRFNIIDAWYGKHIDSRAKYISEFLELNEIFRVGVAREEAYIELMKNKIEEAGMTKQFQNDTDQLIEQTESLRKDHIELLQQVEQYQRDAAEKFENVTNIESFNALITVLDNTDHFLL